MGKSPRRQNPALPWGLVEKHRQVTFRLTPRLKLKSRAGAVRFVNERGFIFFWPIQCAEFPSLWSAVAGDRPVPDFHDDPAHITWGWKDSMLDKKKWYYAKVLRNKSTIISLEAAPYFCAFTKSYGDPELDCRLLFEQGRLSQPAHTIYQALIRHAPIDTFNLRQKVHVVGKEFNGQFGRGVVELQRNFKILPVGVAETGRWGYSFIFDLVYNHFPYIVAQAVDIPPAAAQRRLASICLESLGAVTGDDMRRLFGWPADRVELTLKALVTDRTLDGPIRFKNRPDEYYILARLA
jgi:hypothetical protein